MKTWQIQWQIHNILNFSKASSPNWYQLIYTLYSVYTYYVSIGAYCIIVCTMWFLRAIFAPDHSMQMMCGATDIHWHVVTWNDMTWRMRRAWHHDFMASFFSFVCGELCLDSCVQQFHVMSCHVISNFMSCRFHFMSCHFMSCHFMSYHFMSYHFMSCHRSEIDLTVLNTHDLSYNISQDINYGQSWIHEEWHECRPHFITLYCFMLSVRSGHIKPTHWHVMLMVVLAQWLGGGPPMDWIQVHVSIAEIVCSDVQGCSGVIFHTLFTCDCHDGHHVLKSWRHVWRLLHANQPPSTAQGADLRYWCRPALVAFGEKNVKWWPGPWLLYKIHFTWASKSKTINNHDDN